ncbi:DUF899 domain-containing protein [Mycobacteroides salmoniphilum]|uniref:CalU12 protein n=1 Tax=Mycobacteroides salmoniphilum TaxID=404941 RepID=A0A4R8SV88_9MYCO|nr:DUF899 domain-containing protein [Mycobacteroides salmoniphilum]TEA04121.1 hypothetical protein CCUG60884_02984 [Mycobacteroides salmoniphilum]
MRTPPIVSAQDWAIAHQQLLTEEKAFTRARDALAAKRRRMPWTEVDASYRFEGPEGPVTLVDLFQGRRQLIVYRAFIDPGTGDWPEHGCTGCSLMADHIGNLAHLNARDTTLIYASRGSQADLDRIKARMGWHHPWYTIAADSSFDRDFDVDDWHGTNAFIRDGNRVYRTYFIKNRGDEAFNNTWTFLDMTALGRQETWEDSPEGYPQSPAYEWWDWHDEYGSHQPSRWFGDPDPDDPHDPRPAKSCQ